MSTVLYRCRTPTDWLCPCGRVARALRAAGEDVEEIRVPWRRWDRVDVRALSGQDHVPLAVVDGDPICDSRRILDQLRIGRTTPPDGPGMV